MAFDRKLVSGEDEVAKFIDGCSLAGINVIELQWTKLRDWHAEIIGIEYPVIRQNKHGGFSADLDYNIQFIEGSIKFYPDNNKVCWGYIADTDNNRTTLAKLYKFNYFRILDQNIRKDIEEVAKAIGEPLVIEKPDEVDVYVRRGDQDKKLEEMAKERELLLKRLEELEKKASVREEEFTSQKIDKPVEEEKPLAGKKIKRKK